MSRILYLSAGNPISPRVGMDMVSFEHIKELSNDAHNVDCIVVAPGIANQPAAGEYKIETCKVTVFVGDLLNERRGLLRAWHKLKFRALHSVPLMAYSFKSALAQQKITETLVKGSYDVLVVDHFYTLANVTIPALKACGLPIVYISHNATQPHLLEMAQMKPGGLRRLYYVFEAWRAGFAERALFALSSKVIHLSEYERQGAAEASTGKHLALLPMLYNGESSGESQHNSPASAQYRQSLIFVGSPSHPPNAHALNWIVNALAPALLKVAPEAQILLAGGGTERLNSAKHPNVCGLGFVSNEMMATLLASCACAISPTTQGRGIKVKVLEAIAAGCPVLATKESLRGFESFPIEPRLRVDQVEAAANTIAALITSPEKRSAERARTHTMWRQFLSNREGQLLSAVLSATAISTTS